MEFKLEIAGEPIRFYITSDKVSLLSETDISHPINVNIGGQEYVFTGRLEAEPDMERESSRFNVAVS